jgi:hypothetical protein
MDGAVTGQFANLPIEQLKMCLGLLKAKTRTEDFAWRCIGYVKHFLPETTKAKDMMRECAHVDIDNYLPDSDNDDDEEDLDDVVAGLDGETLEDYDAEEADDEAADKLEEDPLLPTCHAQDLHTMMSTFLESYGDLEKNGLDWDLPFKGKTYKVHFVFYIPFIKGDSVEHDKHCGAYNAKTAGVKNLCRYCTVPNDETDNAHCDYPRKTMEMLKKLIEDGDICKLKEISQQFIDNCWYPHRFGFHRPELGVHGACLLELLHWLQLGKYKYIRNCFFEQIGPTSQLARDINALAKAMGYYY